MSFRFLLLWSLGGWTALFAGQAAGPAAGPSPLRVSGYFSADYAQEQRPGGGWEGTFTDARGGVLFSGEWSANFSFAFEIAAVPEFELTVEQAWALVKFSEALQVRAGLYLVPFGRYNETRRPFQTTLVLDPFPVGRLFPASWRDLGLVLTGRLGRLGYSGYLGNGLAEGETLAAGQQFRDHNPDKGRGGRLTYRLAQNLEVGASYFTAKVDLAGGRRQKAWGADILWGSDAFRVVGEYAKVEIANPEAFAPGVGEGYFGMVSFKLGPLLPVASYEALSYRDPYHGPGFGGPGVPGAGIARTETRWALGLVYPLHPNVLLKGEYDFNREKEEDLRTEAFRVQVAVRF